MIDDATIRKRRHRVAGELGTDSPALVISSGQTVDKPSRMGEVYDFEPSPVYYWLTGSRR